MLTGMTVDNVRFLGPLVGDEDVPDIRNASAALRLNRITLMENKQRCKQTKVSSTVLAVWAKCISKTVLDTLHLTP